ncbi:hypothetical protein AU196_06760 [Mycobacterium sp. IS-1742]|uniref:hypothetical protein n=1 Tax=Mycobacterium sp. IS-1742 TaxID=1772285 RepID=UPI00073FF3CF|nr:hypothetical protein [Mycobacterium sp. IS-1742]KUI24990.1 hypothetical protein AU196_06760 [Mycobacterium sp. IS-1742]
MRTTASAVPLVVAVAALTAAPAGADPLGCEEPACVPGIAGNVTLGASCADTSHYVFGTTEWGRLVFCGSPRRYAPRYFRSPPMEGIRELHTNCTGFENSVAQAPDGLFLACVASSGESRWVQGDNA